MRWFSPPPSLTAIFSNALNPGVVFLVSRIFTPFPFNFSTYFATCVEIPDSLWRKFSAILSAFKILTVEPWIVITFIALFTKSPSFLKVSIFNLVSIFLKTFLATSNPQIIKSSFAVICAKELWLSGTRFSEVISPFGISSAIASSINLSTFSNDS